jgi:hypothetical protein
MKLNQHTCMRITMPQSKSEQEIWQHKRIFHCIDLIYIYFQSHIRSFARCVLRIAREREIRKGKG